MATTEDPITMDDLVILTSWLADRGYKASTLAYAVEKPWKYRRELAVAKAALEHEHANPCGDAFVLYESNELIAYCGGTKECDWKIDLSDEEDA